jgi:hypothetical protein
MKKSDKNRREKRDHRSTARHTMGQRHSNKPSPKTIRTRHFIRLLEDTDKVSSPVAASFKPDVTFPSPPTSFRFKGMEEAPSSPQSHRGPAAVAPTASRLCSECPPSSRHSAVASWEEGRRKGRRGVPGCRARVRREGGWTLPRVRFSAALPAGGRRGSSTSRRLSQEGAPLRPSPPTPSATTASPPHPHPRAAGTSRTKRRGRQHPSRGRAASHRATTPPRVATASSALGPGAARCYHELRPRRPHPLAHLSTST